MIISGKRAEQIRLRFQAVKLRQMRLIARGLTLDEAFTLVPELVRMATDNSVSVEDMLTAMEQELDRLEASLPSVN